MTIVRSLTALVALLSVGQMTLAVDDNPFNAGRSSSAARSPQKSGRTVTNPFNAGRGGNFNEYRMNLNAEYARQIKEQQWREHRMNKGQQPPDRDTKPVSPIEWQEGRSPVRDDRQIVIDEVITPIKGGSQATPISPIEIDDGAKPASLRVDFLGQALTLRGPSQRFSVTGNSPSAIADAWTRLSKSDYDPLVADCLSYKQQNSLCDWAFLQFLEAVAKAAASGSDSRALLMTYLAGQAGYAVRLATTAEGALDMMYSSQHLIFSKPYIQSDGKSYYPYFTDSSAYRLCQSFFKGETGISLWIPRLPDALLNASQTRTVKSGRYPDFKVSSSVNKNLITFYSTYPTSKVGANPVSRWAMYANTPVSDHVRENVYPQLRKLIAGLSPLEAVQRILNWIQTGFVYEYDDKVWGGDRAFFPEETLYYPYCDCEDRSILLTRLVRDLLGLKCLLIYYPGHLAAAVNFPSDVAGDYIVTSGRRFTITDPTYIGAPVGETMPSMDNSTAKVILLD